MQKRHFEMIAAQVKAAHVRASLRDWTEGKRCAITTVEQLAEGFANQLAAEFPKFDKVRFLQACKS